MLSVQEAAEEQLHLHLWCLADALIQRRSHLSHFYMLSNPLSFQRPLCHERVSFLCRIILEVILVAGSEIRVSLENKSCRSRVHYEVVQAGVLLQSSAEPGWSFSDAWLRVWESLIISCQSHPHWPITRDVEQFEEVWCLGGSISARLPGGRLERGRECVCVEKISRLSLKLNSVSCNALVHEEVRCGSSESESTPSWWAGTGGWCSGLRVSLRSVRSGV